MWVCEGKGSYLERDKCKDRSTLGFLGSRRPEVEVGGGSEEAVKSE